MRAGPGDRQFHALDRHGAVRPSELARVRVGVRRDGDTGHAVYRVAAFSAGNDDAFAAGDLCRRDRLLRAAKCGRPADQGHQQSLHGGDARSIRRTYDGIGDALLVCVSVQS